MIDDKKEKINAHIKDGLVEDIEGINFYLDFSIEGVIRSDEKEIDDIKKSINKIINKILEEKKLSNINIRMSKYSDIDIAMLAATIDEEFH